MDIEILTGLYFEKFGVTPVEIVRLPGAGGGRIYYRMSHPAEGRVLGVVADNTEESRGFIFLSQVFLKNGLNVPEVYAFTQDYKYYIEEDLGDSSLFSLLGSDSGISLAAKCMKQLALLQTVPEEEWEDKVVFAPFSKRQIMWDLNYFKYEYLKPASIPFDENLLEDDFDKFSEDVLTASAGQEGFMMRDCQSRNVMVKDDCLYWIDFQGGRKGPGIYDAVSFLWQAKAGFSDDTRRELLNVYIDSYSGLKKIDRKILTDSVGIFAAFRTLQVLGAYGFRGLVEKKAHFIESIPGALSNLQRLLEKGMLSPYPELEKVCSQLVVDSRFVYSLPVNDSDKCLTVDIFSFSYKKGYPDDFTGNGGGFMFDCRGMHNPGRYPEYKSLTGEDREVIEFLEDRGEVFEFVSKAVEMVSPTVARYIDRGFRHLQIGFGCTGGQHRSVYCANATAEILSRKFPGVRICLHHREQGKDRVINDVIANMKK